MRAPRFTADHRRVQIFQTAWQLSEAGNLYGWTLDDIAQNIDTSISSVKYYFSSVQGLRSEVIVRAIKEKNYRIVEQAVITHDPLVANIPVSMREKIEKKIRQPRLI